VIHSLVGVEGTWVGDDMVGALAGHSARQFVDSDCLQHLHSNPSTHPTPTSQNASFSPPPPAGTHACRRVSV
jgi:hypothetical protein